MAGRDKQLRCPVLADPVIRVSAVWEIIHGAAARAVPPSLS